MECAYFKKTETFLACRCINNNILNLNCLILAQIKLNLKPNENQ